MTNFYGATSLIGGGFGALDSIDGAVLADLDGAVVISDNKFYPMRLDADNAGAESSPLVISPDSNAGDKRWVLNEIVCAGIYAKIRAASEVGVKIQGATSQTADLLQFSDGSDTALSHFDKLGRFIIGENDVGRNALVELDCSLAIFGGVIIH